MELHTVKPLIEDSRSNEKDYSEGPRGKVDFSEEKISRKKEDRIVNIGTKGHQLEKFQPDPMYGLARQKRTTPRKEAIVRSSLA